MATDSSAISKVEIRWFKGAQVECVVGDIAAQPGLHAVVSSTSSDLGARGTVAGTVHRQAGQALAAECRRYAPLNAGSAVITRAYGLPNRYIIHCRGPRYTEHPDPHTLLANCYRQALGLAHEHGVASIGFPAISTGHGGFPWKESARVALETIIATLPSCRSVRRVRMVLRDAGSFNIHAEVLAALSEDKSES
ncbi:MAG: macro domain-containing protein [Pseudomonadales bacterium]